MGARTPTILRPRRGAIKCEYCRRSLGSFDALVAHQKTLHASALRRKQKLLVSKKLSKPAADKTKPKSAAEVVQKRVKKVLPPNLKKTVKKPQLDAKEAPKPQRTLRKPKPQSKAVDTPANIDPVAKNAELAAKDIDAAAEPKSEPHQAKKVSKPKKVAKAVNGDPKMEAKKTGSGVKAEEKRKIEFKCPKCEKVFPVCFSAQKHIKKAHCENSEGVPVDPESPDLIQPILVELCSVCDVKYSGTHECLRTPKLEFNVPEDTLSQSSTGPYGCIACRKTFERLGFFQKHVASLHNDGLESMLFPTVEEFEKWRHEMEAQTKTLYVWLGRNGTKHYYQCCSTLSEQNVSLSCPSLIAYQVYPTGIQVHFYKHHFEHEFKPYTMEDAYKNYSIADVIAESIEGVKAEKQEKVEREESQSEEEDEDLYVKFKSLMENITADAAKVNMNTLKVLIDKALNMNTILNQYNDLDESQDSTSILNPLKRKGDLNASPTNPYRKKFKTALNRAMAHKSPILQHKSQVKRFNYSLANDKDSEKILQELDETRTFRKNLESTGSSTIVSLPRLDCSPTAFNDSYKNFVSSVTRNERKQTLSVRKDVADRNRKRSLKTKMGQFSPKKNTAKGGPLCRRRKTKDIKYEVKERDNDCNILILKI